MMAARTRALLAIALLGVAPRLARAGVQAVVNPGYAANTSETRDETGTTTKTDSEAWIQRYRLALDNQLYPQLSVGGGANLDWTSVDSWSPDPVLGTLHSRAENRTWNTFARVTGGSPVLGGGLDWSRRWGEAETSIGGVSGRSSSPVRQAYSGTLAWRPADLPALSLRLGRTDAYDSARTSVDQTTDEASLDATYRPVDALSLGYGLRYGRSVDHLRAVERADLQNSFFGSYAEKYLDGRGSFYLSYSGAARTSDATAPGGTTVPIQQVPLGGLSIVEAFPATPARVTLNPNAALVDGDTSASAGVNLGTSAGGGPVLANRDLGAQFRDLVTPVSEIQVYLDRPIPADLAARFTFTVWQSSDNVDWTQVALAGPVRWNEVLLRFEVPIPRTQARYLKVVTTPLPATATTDPQLREIFVTELMFFNVIPAEEARGRSSDYGGTLTGTTRIVLLPAYNLAYDFSGLLSHGGGRDVIWSIVNGLGMARRLSPVFAVASRLDRTDGVSGRGHEAQNRWSGTLSADPIPAAGASLSYSGQVSQTREGTALSNSGVLSLRADLYEGVGLGASSGASWLRGPTHRESRSFTSSGSLSLVPNRWVSTNGSVSYIQSYASGGGQPSASDRRGVVDLGASATPFSALVVAGTWTRQFGGATRPVTLTTFSGAFSPFPGGDLQLRYTYSETYESAGRQRTRFQGPGLRWNIRRGWSLDAAYTLQDATAPAASQHTRSFLANLLIRLP